MKRYLLALNYDRETSVRGARILDAVRYCRVWERLYVGAGTLLYDTLAGRRALPRHREDERNGADQMRAEPLEHERLLAQRFAHEAEIELLEIAQAAVDQFARAAGSSGRPITLLEKSAGKTARGRVERRARARHPAPTTTTSNVSPPRRRSAARRCSGPSRPFSLMRSSSQGAGVGATGSIEAMRKESGCSTPSMRSREPGAASAKIRSTSCLATSLKVSRRSC